MYRNRLAVSPGPGEPGWESLQSLDRLKELKVFKNYLHKDHSSGYLSAKEVFERNNQLEEEISQLKNTLAKIVDDLLSTNQEKEIDSLKSQIDEISSPLKQSTNRYAEELEKNFVAVSQQVKQIFLKTVRLSYQESPATKDLPLSPSLQSPVHIPTRTPVHTPVHQPGMDNSLSATQVDQQTLLKALVHSRKENAMLQDRVADLEDDIWKMRKATTEEINFLRDSLDQLVKERSSVSKMTDFTLKKQENRIVELEKFLSDLQEQREMIEQNLVHEQQQSQHLVMREETIQRQMVLMKRELEMLLSTEKDSYRKKIEYLEEELERNSSQSTSTKIESIKPLPGKEKPLPAKSDDLKSMPPIHKEVLKSPPEITKSKQEPLKPVAEPTKSPPEVTKSESVKSTPKKKLAPVKAKKAAIPEIIDEFDEDDDK